ncbi:MAG: hypothetical protein AB7F43_13725 [Bacteriovoracia bacterium]
MLKKKLIITLLVSFVSVFVTDMIIHQHLLGELYRQNAHLWRTEMEMGQHLHFMLLGQILVAICFAFIFTKGYEKKGLAEGARYGALMAAFTTGGLLINHAVLPYPLALTMAWVVTTFIQNILVGILIAYTYKKIK